MARSNQSIVLRYAQSYKSLLIFLIFTFCFFKNIPCHAQTTNGLVLWWKFDDGSSGPCTGTTADSSGKSNTGTCENSPSWVTGKLGSALSFSSASRQYVTVSQTGLQFDKSSITVAMWVKPSDSGALETLEGFGDDGSFAGFRIYLENRCGNNNSFAFSVASSTANNIERASNFQYTAGTWYHVVGVWDTSVPRIRIYVNGIEDAAPLCTVNNNGTEAGITSISNNQNDFAIGIYSAERSTSFNYSGIIDDVRIYNRALTPGEVYELFENGAQVHMGAEF